MNLTWFLLFFVQTKNTRINVTIENENLSNFRRRHLQTVIYYSNHVLSIEMRLQIWSNSRLAIKYNNYEHKEYSWRFRNIIIYVIDIDINDSYEKKFLSHVVPVSII